MYAFSIIFVVSMLFCPVQLFSIRILWYEQVYLSGLFSFYAKTCLYTPLIAAKVCVTASPRLVE